MPDISPVTIAVLIVGIVYAAARILAAAYRFDLTRWLNANDLHWASFNGKYAHDLIMLKQTERDIEHNPAISIKKKQTFARDWLQLVLEYGKSDGGVGHEVVDDADKKNYH